MIDPLPGQSDRLAVSSRDEKNDFLPDERVLTQSVLTYNDKLYLAWYCNRGLVVQNQRSLCQLSLSDYSLSLDSLICQKVIISVPLKQQPFTIKLTIISVVVMIVIGLLLNTLTILTFYSSNSREVGCTLYILCSSCLGQIRLIILGISIYNRVKLNQMTDTIVHELIVKEILKEADGTQHPNRGETVEILLKGTDEDHVFGERIVNFKIGKCLLQNIIPV
ncbi:unnamed protein product [Didymodactylos carnosus]|uniref:Uncharacterized protein n=1 Tax=Didymodactylos carnosus TaxID=1234261 RepID=A0A8S2DKV6_9BILA|nr:unnamed protein product [Didymodactylos carnosus]CAF3738943.1 unnamed protein product [Didymodactylos carnosus]